MLKIGGVGLVVRRGIGASLHEGRTTDRMSESYDEIVEGWAYRRAEYDDKRTFDTLETSTDCVFGMGL